MTRITETWGNTPPPVVTETAQTHFDVQTSQFETVYTTNPDEDKCPWVAGAEGSLTLE